MALLLAGGGAKSRRQAALVAEGGLSVDALQEAGCPRALLVAVKEALGGPAQKMLQRVNNAGWRWLIPENDEFPEALKQSADPPLGLFLRGRLEKAPVAAIVGGRRATTYGQQAARLLGEAVAEAGGVVVSGMARGIDSAAHRGALGAHGKTWAVWASGPDKVYPPEHGPLAEEIVESGALLTEYPPGTPARKHHFLERNRLIAGLARVVVVVEAAARSGALSTARQALDEGREVMAVPGSIFCEVAVGPHGLLRPGAAPVTKAGDVIEALGLEERGRESEEEHPLCGVLGPEEALPVDEIAQRMGRPVEQVLVYILELELEGTVARSADGTYRRGR